jgi:hypothetical protein
MISTETGNWTWWFIPKMPALGRQRQKDSKLKVNLGYIVKPISKTRDSERERQIKNELVTINFPQRKAET